MDDNNNEREELRKVQAVFEKAVENNTIEDLRPYIAPDFSYVSFTDRSFSDFDDFCRQWKITRDEIVGSGRYTTQLNPEPSLFFGDIAVCQGNSSNNMVDKKGKEFNFTSNWTVVFKRDNGAWQVLRAHNSLDPFNNPMLVHAIRSKLIEYGVVAFILGGALCSLLTYMLLH